MKKRENAERELLKVRKQIAEWQVREKELEGDIREAAKEEVVSLMEKHSIHVAELRVLLKERETENQKILKEKRKREIEDETDEKETYQDKTDADC